jgi:hypothetical protein
MGKILMQSGGGTPTDDATATAADMVVGAIAYVDDELVEGSMVEREGEQPTTGVTVSDGLVHVGMLPGAYRKNGRYGTPEVKASVDTVAQAAGVDASKMLQGYNVLGKAGQIAVINTMGSGDGKGAYSYNHGEFGIDTNNQTLWIHLPQRSAYYTRPDGYPHVTMPSSALGDAVREQLLKGARCTSKWGMNFEGSIQRWVRSGDIGGQGVMDALENTVFAGDYGARGRVVFMRMPGGSYINPDIMWAQAPAPTLLPQNIRAGVSILGVQGTMPDYAATCVPFENAHFDGTHLSGWATGKVSGNRLQVGDAYRDELPRENGSSDGKNDWWWAFTPSVDLAPFREVKVTLRTEAVNATDHWWVDNRVYMTRVNGSPGNRSASPIREVSNQIKGVSTISIPVSDISRQVFIVVKIHVGNLFRKEGHSGRFLAKVEKIELIA